MSDFSDARSGSSFIVLWQAGAFPTEVRTRLEDGIVEVRLSQDVFDNSNPIEALLEVLAAHLNVSYDAMDVVAQSGQSCLVVVEGIQKREVDNRLMQTG